MAQPLAPSQPNEEFNLNVSWETDQVLANLNGGFALLIPLGVLAFVAGDAETMAILHAIPAFEAYLAGICALFASFCVLAFARGFEAPRRIRIVICASFLAIMFVTICLMIWARFFVTG